MATAVDTLQKDAELVVDVCMSVEQDDVVTIICDDEHREQADAVARVCLDRGAWPVIMNNEAQVARGRVDTRFPMAPPRNLHNAMTSSDEVIILTNLEWANRFAHVNAVRETCAANGKIASVEEGMGAWELTRGMIEEATQLSSEPLVAGCDNVTAVSLSRRLQQRRARPTLRVPWRAAALHGWRSEWRHARPRLPTSGAAARSLHR